MRILYIDGGGTKTAGYLVENGSLISKNEVGASNINSNYDESIKNIELLLTNFDKYEKVVLGLAGAKVNLKKEEEMIRYLISKYNVNFELYTDLELIAMLSINPKNEKGILLNLGTGTAAIYYDLKNYNTVLGWGKIIGDIGSGYDIGIHFLQFLAKCEDTNSKDDIYNKFLNDFNISSLREYIKELNNIKSITCISKWLSSQDEKVVNKFIVPRVKYVLDYLSFIDVNNIFLTGSIFIKNDIVKNFVSKYYSDKNVKYVTFNECFK